MPTLHQATQHHIDRAVRKVSAWWLLWLPLAVRRRLGGLLRALHAGVRMNRARRSVVFNFRRNVHRLEKGLSFPDRRTIFAEDYIEETVRLLRDGVESAEFDAGTVDWGRAVLTRYFEVVEETPAIRSARSQFEALGAAAVDEEQVPYPAGRRPPACVTFDQLESLARRRRSVRFYADRTVEIERVRKAVRVAAQAPSACNRQAYRFFFFDEPRTVAALSQVPGGLKGYSVPSLVVVVGRYRGYFDERDLKAPIVDASLSVMSFILALETLGLSSVCINWPNNPLCEREIRTIIRLDPDEFVVMMVGVGYADPAGLVPYSAKHAPEDLLPVNERIRPR